MLHPTSAFITGANRGLGLEFVKQFCALSPSPKHVFATCRDPGAAKDLQKLASANANIHIIKFDVSDFDALPNVAQQVESLVGEKGLNLLINNAAITGSQSFNNLTPEEMMEVYKVNAIAPIMLFRALLPLLKKAASKSGEAGMSCNKAAVMNVSTKVASIADNTSGGMWSYRNSKSALNMINKNESIEVKKDGILTVLLHPGWVQTDLGSSRAPTTTAESVSGLMKVMAGLDESKTGTFWDLKNVEIPW